MSAAGALTCSLALYLATVRTGVHGRRVSLLSLLLSAPLRAALTNADEPQQRKRGVLLLAELLTRLPTLALDDRARRSLLSFFTDRLKDESCVKESLMGLTALVVSRPASWEEAEVVWRALFDAVNVQAQVQSARKLALDMLLHIANTHSEGQQLSELE